jgi:biopolymer transport protein ExbD
MVSNNSDYSKGENNMSETKPNINVTPLIDILLVLLIIFMAISPLKTSNFQTKVPAESKNESLDINPDSLVVIINADSSLKLNNEDKLGTISEPNALIARLNDVFRQRNENQNLAKTIFLKAPKTFPYGEVVKVIDAIKFSEAKPIALQIDNLE